MNFHRIPTLQYLIKARAGINAQGGRSPNFNKHTEWNKRTGWISILKQSAHTALLLETVEYI